MARRERNRLKEHKTGSTREKKGGSKDRGGKKPKKGWTDHLMTKKAQDGTKEKEFQKKSQGEKVAERKKG